MLYSEFEESTLSHGKMQGMRHSAGPVQNQRALRLRRVQSAPCVLPLLPRVHNVAALAILWLFVCFKFKARECSEDSSSSGSITIVEQRDTIATERTIGLPRTLA